MCFGCLGWEGASLGHYYLRYSKRESSGRHSFESSPLFSLLVSIEKGAPTLKIMSTSVTRELVSLGVDFGVILSLPTSCLPER